MWRVPSPFTDLSHPLRAPLGTGTHTFEFQTSAGRLIRRPGYAVSVLISAQAVLFQESLHPSYKLCTARTTQPPFISFRVENFDECNCFWTWLIFRSNCGAL